MQRSRDVTGLLLQWNQGDVQARDELLPLIYEELRDLAGRYMRRERPDHTLQATALVHEAYLRLVDQKRVQWQNRAHFLGIAAQQMRRILVNHAVARVVGKRGAGGVRVSLDEALAVAEGKEAEVVALDEALERLSKLDPQQAKVVELRYFGGMSIQETAEALSLSPATVKREWSMAKGWLHRELTDRGEADAPGLS